jgi:hypothetical protein
MCCRLRVVSNASNINLIASISSGLQRRRSGEWQQCPTPLGLISVSQIPSLMLAEAA